MSINFALEGDGAMGEVMVAPTGSGFGAGEEHTINQSRSQRTSRTSRGENKDR